MGVISNEFINTKIIDSLDDYEEDDLFLTEVPSNLIKSSITTQFEDPLEYRKKDYIQDFLTKYEKLKDNDLQEDEQDIEQLKDDFIIFMEETFKNYLGIGFNEIDRKSDEDQFDIIHFAYKFFIRYIKRNFVNIIINEIKKNTADISRQISERNSKSKNVTYLTFKEEIDDENIVNILSYSNTAVKIILEKISETYNVDDFFKLCDLDEVLVDKEFIKRCYDNFDITGNFIQNYVDMINEEFVIEIETKVRSLILKDYPSRKMKQVAKKEEKKEQPVTNSKEEIIDATTS